MARRSIAWVKDGGLGLEFADVDITGTRMKAGGVAIGTSPEAYRLDYTLATGDSFVTSELHVTARGDGWRRELVLVRGEGGGWSANGVEVAEVAGSLDCD